MTKTCNVGRIDQASRNVVLSDDNATIGDAFRVAGVNLTSRDVIRDTNNTQHELNDTATAGKTYYAVENVKSGN